VRSVMVSACTILEVLKEIGREEYEKVLELSVDSKMGG